MQHLRRRERFDWESSRCARPRADGDGSDVVHGGALLRGGFGGEIPTGQGGDGRDDGGHGGARYVLVLRDHPHLVDEFVDVPPAVPSLGQHHGVAGAEGMGSAVGISHASTSREDEEVLRGTSRRRGVPTTLRARPRAAAGGTARHALDERLPVIMGVPFVHVLARTLEFELIESEKRQGYGAARDIGRRRERERGEAISHMIDANRVSVSVKSDDEVGTTRTVQKNPGAAVDKIILYYTVQVQYENKMEKTKRNRKRT